MRSTRRLVASAALGLALGAALPAVVPAASYAEKATVTDAVGDPVLVDDGDDGGLEITPAPGARAVDIESTRFIYRTDALVIRVRARLATGRVTPSVYVRSGGQDHEFSTDDRGRVHLDSRGGGERCGGATATHNSATKVYRVEIPARCFGSPGGLKAGIKLERVGGGGPSSFVVDDAVKGSDGYPYQTGLGPRLRRG